MLWKGKVYVLGTSFFTEYVYWSCVRTSIYNRNKKPTYFHLFFALKRDIEIFLLYITAILR